MSFVPQFDCDTFINQVFWTSIIFGIFVFFVKYYYIPCVERRISDRNISIFRKNEINQNIKNNISQVDIDYKKVIFAEKTNNEKRLNIVKKLYSSKLISFKKMNIEKMNSSISVYEKKTKYNFKEDVASYNKVSSDIIDQAIKNIRYGN